ncbi:hypothetical protein C8R44DRAFT_27699 [Mycena epipterygia]|nr:hypothetical protein C8R44DRAFT_27699 [Mycena epipterygia]
MIDFCLKTKLDDDTIAKLWMETDRGKGSPRVLGEPPRSEVLHSFHEAGSVPLPPSYSTEWQEWQYIDEWFCWPPDWIIAGYTCHQFLTSLAQHGLRNTPSRPVYHIMFHEARADLAFRHGTEYYIYCGEGLLFRYRKAYASLEEFLRDPFHVDFCGPLSFDETWTMPPELEDVPRVEGPVSRAGDGVPTYWKIRRTKPKSTQRQGGCTVI